MAAPPDTEAAGFNEGIEDQSQRAAEEAQDVQSVVLVPGEVMGGHAQVPSTSVPHHILHPEHGLVQRLDGALVVDPGQTPGTLLIAAQQTEGSLR